MLYGAPRAALRYIAMLAPDAPVLHVRGIAYKGTRATAQTASSAPSPIPATRRSSTPRLTYAYSVACLTPSRCAASAAVTRSATKSSKVAQPRHPARLGDRNGAITPGPLPAPAPLRVPGYPLRHHCGYRRGPASRPRAGCGTALYDEETLGPFPHDWQARQGRVVLTGEYGGMAGFRHVVDGLGIEVESGQEDRTFRLVQLCGSATGRPLTDDELRLIAGYPQQLALLYPGLLS